MSCLCITFSFQQLEAGDLTGKQYFSGKNSVNNLYFCPGCKALSELLVNMTDASLSPVLWDKFGVLIVQTSTPVSFQSCRHFLVSHLCLRHLQAWGNLDQNYCSLERINTGAKNSCSVQCHHCCGGFCTYCSSNSTQVALVHKGSKGKIKIEGICIFIPNLIQ